MDGGECGGDDLVRVDAITGTLGGALDPARRFGRLMAELRNTRQHVAHLFEHPALPLGLGNSALQQHSNVALSDPGRRAKLVRKHAQDPGCINTHAST
jgi:hypothetical protein